MADPNIERADKATFSMLMSYPRDENGQCSPGQEKIAADLGVGSVDTIQRSMANLERGDVITMEKQRRGNALVGFPGLAPDELRSRKPAASRKNQEAASGAASSKSLLHSQVKPATKKQKDSRGESRSREESLNTKKEGMGGERAYARAWGLPTEPYDFARRLGFDDEEIAQMFDQYRDRMGGSHRCSPGGWERWVRREIEVIEGKFAHPKTYR